MIFPVSIGKLSLHQGGSIDLRIVFAKIERCPFRGEVCPVKREACPVRLEAYPVRWEAYPVR